MSRLRLRVLGGALALAAMCGATACATTIDSSLATTTTLASQSTTTTLPVGDAATLLPQLLEEASTLSRRVRQNDGDRDALERMDALWAASRSEVGSTAPELLGSFDGQLALAGRAVQYNRPADADKAYRNLTALVDSFLA
jgi:hypothetical protein